MSRQSEANARTLGLFRLCLVIGLLVCFMWTLVSLYQSNRAATQATSMQTLASQFTLQLAQVHGLWLTQNRASPVAFVLSATGDPASLMRQNVAVGPRILLQMTQTGWPKNVQDDEKGEPACARLWQALLAQPLELNGDKITVSTEDSSCRFQLGEAGFIYYLDDGRVANLSGGFN